MGIVDIDKNDNNRNWAAILEAENDDMPPYDQTVLQRSRAETIAIILKEREGGDSSGGRSMRSMSRKIESTKVFDDKIKIHDSSPHNFDPENRDDRGRVKTYIELTHDRLGEKKVVGDIGHTSDEVVNSLYGVGSKDLLTVNTGHILRSAPSQSIRNEDIRSFQNGWGMGSISNHSLALQDSVSRLFSHSGSLAPELGKSDPKLRDRADIFARSQYKVTQGYLHDHPELSHVGSDGQRYITLYRGISIPKEQNYLSSQSILSKIKGKDHVDMTIDQNPLSSWSISSDMASTFADWNRNPGSEQLVLSSDVPVDRIFATGISGTASPDEGEFVVIGGPSAVRITRMVRK